MDGGELLYRAAYQGKHTVRKMRVRQEERGTLMTRTLVCGLLAAILWACGRWIPGVRNTVRELLGERLDYRAAFSAAGETLTGSRDVQAVWHALTGKTEDVSVPVEKEVSGPLPGLETRTELAAAQLLRYDAAGTVEIPAEHEPLYELFSEKLLPFPEEEQEPAGNTPEKVSYEKLVLAFDYACPLEGRITSGFGFRIHPITKKLSFHYGIDIGAPQGSDITAFADGTVELVSSDSSYGNYLFLRHSDGILSFYGHCSSIDVEAGQLVRLGEVVAHVGSTGLSTGPHLHFEVRSGDKVLDPSQYIELPEA